MSKPTAVRMASDDCEVTTNGETYHPHEGEWIEVMPGGTVEDQRLQSELTRAKDDLAACEGDEDETEKVIAFLDKVNAGLCARAAEYLLAWSWTDDRGRPLPQPDGTPEIFYALRQEEVVYIWLKACKPETQEERKNGSRPLQITSSATARRRSRS